jgi:hypothetical protein
MDDGREWKPVNSLPLAGLRAPFSRSPAGRTDDDHLHILVEQKPPPPIKKPPPPSSAAAGVQTGKQQQNTISLLLVA